MVRNRRRWFRLFCQEVIQMKTVFLRHESGTTNLAALLRRDPRRGAQRSLRDSLLVLHLEHAKTCGGQSTLRNKPHKPMKLENPKYKHHSPPTNNQATKQATIQATNQQNKQGHRQTNKQSIKQNKQTQQPTNQPASEPASPPARQPASEQARPPASQPANQPTN